MNLINIGKKQKNNYFFLKNILANKINIINKIKNRNSKLKISFKLADFNF